MPRMSELRTVVENFTTQLAQVIEAQIMERARHAVAAALGGNGQVPARRGRPPKSVAMAAAWEPKKKPRKKAPKQLCPVPGCSNPAAPVFGMVCAKHKDLPKLKIRKFREARRAKKLGVAAPKKAGRPAGKGRKKIVRRKKAVAAASAPAAATPAAS
jgi:hypothetical protein